MVMLHDGNHQHGIVITRRSNEIENGRDERRKENVSGEDWENGFDNEPQGRKDKRASQQFVPILHAMMDAEMLVTLIRIHSTWTRP